MSAQCVIKCGFLQQKKERKAQSRFLPVYVTPYGNTPCTGSASRLMVSSCLI